MNNRQGSGGFQFEVITHIGTLAKYASGWTKELNIISWGGANPKFDIRDWNADHSQLSRGITLHKEEARALMNLLQERFKGVDAEPPRKGWTAQDSQNTRDSYNRGLEAGQQAQAAASEQAPPAEEPQYEETEVKNQSEYSENMAQEDELSEFSELEKAAGDDTTL